MPSYDAFFLFWEGANIEDTGPDGRKMELEYVKEGLNQYSASSIQHPVSSKGIRP